MNGIDYKEECKYLREKIDNLVDLIKPYRAELHTNDKLRRSYNEVIADINKKQMKG